MLARIYTESFPNLPMLVTARVNGATLLQGVGIFRGMRENAAIIELLDVDRDTVLVLAEDIRRANNQTSVLVTFQSADVFNVTAAGSEVIALAGMSTAPAVNMPF